MAQRLTPPARLLVSVLLLAATALNAQQTAQNSTVSDVAEVALHERTGMYFGMWTNPETGYSDTPALVNARLGINVSVFQIAQMIPLPKYNYTTGAGGPAPEYLIEQTETDAAVCLTVYPEDFESVTDDDLKALGTQLATYTEGLNRAVFLRFAPEMQGMWNTYGFQPTAYLALWNRMHKIVKDAAPKTAIVWAPNTPQSYPYGQTTSTLSAADLTALDTNHDGHVTNADDPFMPFYPGDAFVDWIGLSTYYKGPNFQNINVAQPRGFCASVLNGTTATSTFSWYDMFCKKPGKACMIAESGAAYHIQAINNAASTAKTALDLQQAWWQDCITSPTFRTQFPRLKMTMHFEHEKLESDGGSSDLRDYRLTNDTNILAAFRADLTAALDGFIVAAYRPRPTDIPDAGRPTVANPGAPKNDTGIVFQTHRNPQVTGPPTLFGHVKGDGSKTTVAAVLGTTLFGLLGVLVGMKAVIM